MKVVITIPAYNEEKTIGKVLDEITRVMDTTAYTYELLVVNDGSVDATAAVANAHGARVVSHPRNCGLAYTFHTEMRECLALDADIIVHTDADGQYDSRYIPSLILAVERGADLALGSRFKGRIRGMPLMNRLGNRAFAFVFSHLLDQKITDTTTGFRAFTAEVATDIPITNTFTYTQEQLIHAAKRRYNVVEVPIATRKTRPSRLFKSPLRYAFKAWINILRIYRDYDPVKFFGSFGLGFFGVGFVLGLWLLGLFVLEGKIGHYPSIVLSALLMIVGLQILLFGFLADMFRKD